MNSEKLSNRLETVVKYIPRGLRLADIGSDHAYLPCYAIQKGVIPFAIAGEVVEGPFQSAKQQVEDLGLTDKISVRKGNGLAVIKKGEVDCITIAGMGGALITSILEKGKDKLAHVKRLILQPNISAISIRIWLRENGWILVAEEILEEDEKIYEILVAEKGNEKASDKNTLEKSLLFGPFLLEQKSLTFQKKWLAEKRNWINILNQLEKASSTEENRVKKQELTNKIRLVEEELEN
ncbi:tRNA (adenine-N(1))-methyltransferase [Bacillus sp. V3B]|uniref:tRNA (adenine(22)-N(1))-methyltransferase n=1 Tax=Bacillus sp. V3B TaxID=2804915 RepID=UPI00210F0F97|nr:tRNA (adenine(22)-N(1))-methyltransferase TrmK [Bacillus sp. V3B]MCQ6273653.1 tRNA (adenine-N(1))-methyltransferase [Bacillus sp. V3B]